MQTITVDQSLNPVWNKYGEFAIQKEDSPEDSELIIKVWDKDIIGADDYLGVTMFPLKNLKGKGKRLFPKLALNHRVRRLIYNVS